MAEVATQGFARVTRMEEQGSLIHLNLETLWTWASEYWSDGV